MFAQRRILPLLGGANRRQADPYWGNVNLLLNMDGASGSTTFTDLRGNHTITAIGNAQVSTASPKFGSGAFISDGTGDYLKTGALSAGSSLDLSSGDFTIELWINPASFSGNQGICSWGDNYPTDYGGEFYMNSTGQILLNRDASTSILSGGSSLSTGVWSHIAVTRSGNSYRSFINGVQNSSATYVNGLVHSTTGFFFCGNTVEGVLRNGTKVDEFRVTKGVARYTAAFTPPTTAFANF